MLLHWTLLRANQALALALQLPQVRASFFAPVWLGVGPWKALDSASIAGGTDEDHVLSLRFVHARLGGRSFRTVSAQQVVARLIVDGRRVEVHVQVVREENVVRVWAARRVLCWRSDRAGLDNWAEALV